MVSVAKTVCTSPIWANYHLLRSEIICRISIISVKLLLVRLMLTVEMLRDFTSVVSLRYYEQGYIE